MKLTSLLLMTTCLQVSANLNAQNISISQHNTTLEKVFKEIHRETGFQFFYQNELLQKSKRFDINVKNVSIEKLLETCFKDQPLNFTIIEKAITIKRKEVVIVLKVPIIAIPIKIKGVVKDEKGNPLVGVSVLIVGDKKGVRTDEEGNFSITAPDNAVLSFSFVGFKTETLPVNGKTSMEITLNSEVLALNEVVVVGYGTQKKVNLTGSISTISSSELEDRPVTQASQALAGLASGVEISQGSGRPGNDWSSITIRGMGTFSGAGNSPLILVDGLASSIDDVDPNNIKSISILKDAASASIYGTRAANGVILIETKRGQKGKLQISYNDYAGWQKVTVLPQFLESVQYAKLTNEASVNQGGSKIYTDAEIAKFQSGSDPDNYPNVPHLKNMVTSGTGFQTNHNLSFMGGDAKNTYLFSLGYLNQDGIVAKNNYNKYNFMLNFDSKIKDNLTLKVNLTGNTAGTNEPRQSSGEMMSMIGYAVREGPVYAGKKSDGTYGYQDNYSPEAWMDSKSFVQRKNKYFQGGSELIWEPFKGFTLSGKAGYNYTNYTTNSYASDFIFNANKTVGPNNLTIWSGENSLLTLQSLARFTHKAGLHDFTILAGYSQEQSKNNWMSGYRQNFPNNSLYTFNAGSATGMSTYGSGSEWALRSYFGRINYSFNNKYLFEANARYDGTSRFPQKGRWGLFPSVSAGWRISEEPFIKENFGWINELKLRGSWGKLGNQNIGNYPFQNVLGLGQNYSFGGVLASGARLTTLSNADIAWEKTRVTDIGLDFSILNNKLSLVFDYFDKATSDILYNISVAQVLGLTPSAVNAGAVKNTGYEILLNYQTSIGKVKIGVKPNFSYVKNKVTQLASGLKQDIGQGLFVGQPLGAIYGYVADGLFVDAADVTKYPTQPYSAEPGFVRYKDISGPNGVPDGKVDATYDRTVIGSTFPKYSYGVTLTADYKGFDFLLLLQGLGGFDKQMGSYMAFAFYNAGQIQQWQVDNRWTVTNPNPNAIYPKLTSLNMSAGTIQTSTYWNRNASFLRLKNLQIGYSFSNSVIQKLKINKLRVFFSGQNLFSLNHFYTGWDPEMYQATGDAPNFYPITSVYTFGLNLKF